MLLLRRIEKDALGVFGELFDEEGGRIAVTCERPDNGNQRMGCIPIGQYKVTHFDSPSKGPVFLLHGVPHRAMIEMHVGNTIADTEGCILVGSERGMIKGKKAVVGSRVKLEQLLNQFPEGFDLKIIEDV